MSNNICNAIVGVMNDIGAVGKNDRNKQQNFMYRGIDAVMNALQPALIKNKVFIVPKVLEEQREERQSKKGDALLYARLKMEYTFFADDGSNISATVIGEAMAKKRSCRRTAEEDRQHDIAVKIRKMTDKQIADLVEGKMSTEKPDPAKKYTREDLDKEFLKGHTIGKSEYEQMVKSLQRQIESLTRVTGAAGRALTREQIRKLPKEQQAVAKGFNNSLLSQQQINKIKRETTEKVADRAFGLAVAVVTNVLKEDYWKKTYKKKMEGFIHACLEKKKKIDSNIMKQYIQEINELCGVDLMGDKL